MVVVGAVSLAVAVDVDVNVAAVAAVAVVVDDDAEAIVFAPFGCCDGGRSNDGLAMVTVGSGVSAVTPCSTDCCRTQAAAATDETDPAASEASTTWSN